MTVFEVEAVLWLFVLTVLLVTFLVMTLVVFSASENDEAVDVSERGFVKISAVVIGLKRVSLSLSDRRGSDGAGRIGLALGI